MTLNLDKAFDFGFNTFDSNGKILISDILEKPKMMGIEEGMKVNFQTSHQR